MRSWGRSPSLILGTGNAKTSGPSPCPLEGGCENTESFVSPGRGRLQLALSPSHTQAVFCKETKSLGATGTVPWQRGLLGGGQGGSRSWRRKSPCLTLPVPGNSLKLTKVDTVFLSGHPVALRFFFRLGHQGAPVTVGASLCNRPSLPSERTGVSLRGWMEDWLEGWKKHGPSRS